MRLLADQHAQQEAFLGESKSASERTLEEWDPEHELGRGTRTYLTEGRVLRSTEAGMMLGERVTR